MSNSNDETNDEEHYDEGSQLTELDNDENEFRNTELENLALAKGPQQILQLILHGQVDDFMEEDITDSDDYADWIKWASNAEERRHVIFKSRGCAEVPMLLQVHQTDSTGTLSDYSGKLTLLDNQDVSIRWKEICQKIQVDQNLDGDKRQQLWKILECYQDVFAWNKGELGCCTVGEHSVDTQRFPPCKLSHGRLS
jgi:hypothetical protein